MLNADQLSQHSEISIRFSGVFLNEFLRGFVNLLGTSDSLRRDTSRNTADSLGDGLGALRYSGCGATYILTTWKRDLSSAGFACRSAFLPSARFASGALATAAFAGGTLTASALAGSRLASRALASRTLSASRLSCR